MTTIAPAPASPQDAHAAPRLSVILPYYRKFREFSLSLPLNARFFRRTDCEVVLVLDDPSDERDTLELLAQIDGVRWRVLVNDTAHEWRSPSVAINVGLRHSEGSFVLVASPESIFADDVPSYVIALLQEFPECAVLGTVSFANYDVSQETSLIQAIRDAVKNGKRTLYGSIAARREQFVAVRGYDETIKGWGGDDDNIRVRLEMAGCRLLACPELHLVHLTLGVGVRHVVEPSRDDLRLRTLLSPDSATANANANWGFQFRRVARDWRRLREHGGTSGIATIAASIHRTVPVGSRRMCRNCGRQIYIDLPERDCACRSDGRQPDLDRFATLPPIGRPRKIACVMQVRNEARYLPGCLRHVEGYVDGIIALDDASTDETRAILEQHPRVMDILANHETAGHVWDERENKRRLLERASHLGFDWVLVCDADERYEQRFLERLRKIAAAFPIGHRSCIGVRVRELWDSATQYRVDGVWGQKMVVRFFALPTSISFAADKALHGQWAPDESRRYGMPQPLHYALYHCKMIRREDRIRRRDFYLALDPQQRFQPLGYEYLTREGPELRVENIPRDRSYDLSTLPESLSSSPPARR